MFTAVMICLVVGIVDGDTIDARCGEPGAYQQIRVRVNAIDAPESKQAFGQASKRSASDLCYMQQAKIAPNNTMTYERVVASVECRGQDLAGHQGRIQTRSATPVDSVNEGGVLRAVDQQFSVHSQR